MTPRRVLVVDDQPDLCEALEAVLTGSELGLTVRTASSAKEALALAAKETFDVALVDVKLPDASGVDLIPQLREHAPYGEVVLVTGFATVDAAIGALRSGAFAFVLKSFRPEELLGVVDQALAKVQLRREREELDRRYRDLVELADILVLGLDADGTVAFINARALALLGRPQDEVLGTHFSSTWLEESDAPALAGAVARLRSSKRPDAADFETTFGDPDQAALRRRRVRWHLGTSAEDPGFVYIRGIDVTERRSLEKRAADVEAMSAMGRIAMNLAHEIRNPLNAAVLQLRLLGRDLERLETDAETKRALRDRGRIVGDEIGRLNQLLTEFLELARPRGLVRLAVDVGDLAENVVELHREALDAQGIVVERDIAHAMATVDAEKVRRALVNLVVNAMEAMRRDDEPGASLPPPPLMRPTLTVRVREESASVALEVSDTGQGMDPSTLESAFDPFFTTKAAGTGLGLAIVRRVVDQHDGDVSVRSAPNQGTTVTIRLPKLATP